MITISQAPDCKPVPKEGHSNKRTFSDISHTQDMSNYMDNFTALQSPHLGKTPGFITNTYRTEWLYFSAAIHNTWSGNI